MRGAWERIRRRLTEPRSYLRGYRQGYFAGWSDAKKGRAYGERYAARKGWG